MSDDEMPANGPPDDLMEQLAATPYAALPGQENDRREVMRYWAWIAERDVLLHDAIEAARRVALTPERAAHRGSAVREHVVDGAEMAALRAALARLDGRERA